MSPYQKLEALGIALPKPVPPVAAFVPVVKAGNLAFVSGHIAKRDGAPWKGRLGDGVSLEEGRRAARAAAVDVLATLDAEVGLGAVKRIVKLMVLVASADSFTDQHLVANGASELLAEVFGDAGKHARSAFGVAALPLGACVEVEVVAELG